MIKTHKNASKNLVGLPISVEENEAVVELKATCDMVVDDMGLIHGGFTFSVADYAAMLAVNHPNVVLASANVTFTAPVKVGDTMRAVAKVLDKDGNRLDVSVKVNVKNKQVLKGDMLCLILDRHVLDEKIK